MNNIEIYLHGENARAPKLTAVPENATVADIIEKYLQEFPGAELPHEIIVFVEDEHEPRNKDHSGFKKRMHLHCHRCNKIGVVIIYNGDDKLFDFSPSTTAKHILKKAVHAFSIAEADAGDYLLKLDDKTILQPADHIGSYTVFPRCHVKLFLTATKPVQG
jgi:hypothetical protein